jgi:hypothetical protein
MPDRAKPSLNAAFSTHLRNLCLQVMGADGSGAYSNLISALQW